MVILTCNDICKSYGEKPVLSNIAFSLNDNDKVGIVGVNGVGKSTLLKIIADRTDSDSGSVIKANNIRIAYLPQNPEFNDSNTVIEQVLAGVNENERELHEYEAKTILTKLGITEFDKKVNLLSGGQKKRVSIASCLAMPSELLILDEPTNHLDNDMITWLEDFLQSYSGAILMITHDRYFLDRVTNRIIELDNGSLYSYQANYTGFLELKAQREEMLQSSERKRQAFLRREIEWVQRGVRARGTKSKSRLEKYEEVKQQNLINDKSNVEISSINSRLGKKTIEIENISKGYDGKTLINGFSYNVLRDDRIGIVGRNGTGKSTLLKIIDGLVKPDSGNVSIGDTVKIGYFSQEGDEMDTSMRVIDYIKEVAEFVDTVDGKISASQLLERFLFSGDVQYNTIERLSGGERRRLLLLRVLIASPNILLLDEPTNDLDIETLGIFEDYIMNFSGAVMTVSHDRYFLDKIANQIFEIKDSGDVEMYVGGYSDYEMKRKEDKKVAVVKEKQTVQPQREKKLKFSFNEQREYDNIDDDIAKLEEKILNVDVEISKQTSDFVKLQELADKKLLLEEELNEKTERWIYLNDLAEKIQMQSK